jgi:hypothetical protein
VGYFDLDLSDGESGSNRLLNLGLNEFHSIEGEDKVASHQKDGNDSSDDKPLLHLIPNEINLYQSVIPGLTRNPVFFWIPAFAGMTCFVVINDAVYNEFGVMNLNIISELPACRQAGELNTPNFCF